LGRTLTYMTPIVLRLRMVSGDQVDVTYEEPGAANDDQVIEHLLATLAHHDGALHCTHGDRLMVVFARGVAAAEVGPRGAIL
jgi:hypothetical protein